jgi:hypothetical protein
LVRLLDAAFATGTLTTIATGGALLGLGWREGEAGRLFRLAGRGLLERSGITSAAAPLTSVALGYVHHLVIATAWGVVLALPVLALRGPGRLVAALVAALGYVICAVSILPPALRIGYAVTSNPPSAFPIGVALALAIVGGIWLDATDENE